MSHFAGQAGDVGNYLLQNFNVKFGDCLQKELPCEPKNIGFVRQKRTEFREGIMQLKGISILCCSTDVLLNMCVCGQGSRRWALSCQAEKRVPCVPWIHR